MEETKKLYPIKFCTIQDEYNWGHEEFKLADLGYKDSLVREGWLAGNSIGELMDTYIDQWRSAVAGASGGRDCRTEI